MVSTRRRTQSDKTQKYAIGDKVEVVRVASLDVGILVSKADHDRRGSPGTTTFWVVSVQGDSNEEEVISEKALGRVLDDSDDSVKSATIEKLVTIEKSVTSEKSAKKPVKKGTKAKNKVASGSKGTRRMNTRATSKSGNGSQSALNDRIDMERRAPSPRPKKKQGDETVIEVKMLTGTLFIYRGENHRVEFVRTV